MKHLLTTIIIHVSLSLSIAAGCGKGNDKATTAEHNINIEDINGSIGGKMKIIVGTAVFTATMKNNATATAFKSKLPLTIHMTELNGNEKYFDLKNALPANASNPGRIQTGDLLLYGANTLVLFYKTFSTSYSYTSIARVDNPSGLAAALGSGDVVVKFEPE